MFSIKNMWSVEAESSIENMSPLKQKNSIEIQVIVYGLIWILSKRL